MRSICHADTDLAVRFVGLSIAGTFDAVAGSPEHTFRSDGSVSAQTKTYSVTYGATMYYRDLTRAAPIVQREIDLVHVAATGDALTVYLWRMTRLVLAPGLTLKADMTEDASIRRNDTVSS